MKAININIVLPNGGIYSSYSMDNFCGRWAHLTKNGYDKSFKAAVKEFIKDMNSDSMPVAVRDQNGNIVGATKLYKKMVNKK